MKLIEHYQKNWFVKYNSKRWTKGPYNILPNNFFIAEFPPFGNRKMWTYATVNMSEGELINRIELHIFSKKQSEEILEILSALVYYHLFTKKVNLNHTVNFGKPWQDSSKCEYGFISLPYLDGKLLETFIDDEGISTKCYWLIPITEKELEFKEKRGVNPLEELFENKRLDYINVNRKSLV